MDATDYIFGEFDGVSKIELMKLMLDYLYEEMPLKFERNEDMMCWIQEKLIEQEEEEEEEEEEICPRCGDEWTATTRCNCPEEEEKSR